jgi:hypothetical protein
VKAPKTSTHVRPARRGASATRIVTLLTLLVVGSHIGFGSAHAQVPSVDDIAACNQEARLRAGTATPTTKDHAGADAARKTAAGTATVRAAPGSEATTAVTQSPDSHIHGMDGSGAADAAYRAAYRVCMRQNGF